MQRVRVENGKQMAEAEKEEKPLEKTGKKTSWDFILWDLVFVQNTSSPRKAIGRFGVCVWLKILVP